MEQPTIRSYRIRGTRITSPQQSALDKYWGIYGIDYSLTPIDPSQLFPNSKEVILEIGFGMGEATALIGRDFPETGFLAVEVHKPGIGKLMARIEELALSNIRIIEGDIHPILQTMIPDKSVEGVHLFFPDPWPKMKHNKRRIVNAEFLALIHQKLIDGGYINIATDWVPYAQWISDVFAGSTQFTGGEVARPDWRPFTKFEGKGLAKDHRVSDFHYVAKG
jgi:tRNA (guanine-N7-)-methyltransferase